MLVLLIVLLEVVVMSVSFATTQLKVYKLSNGATLIVNPRDDTTAVSLQVWFRVGSIYENYQQKGMAHFLEHMLFNGSEEYPYGEIDRLVEEMGGDINAGTSKDYTFYYITVAQPYWQQALRLLYQLTQKPLLQEQMVEKEKPIVIEELRRGKDNPSNVLWEELEKLAYKVSPYRFPIIGFEETIQKFNREMLLEFFRNFYQPQNMYVVVVGDVDPQEVLKVTEETFGKETGRRVPFSDFLPEPDWSQNRFKKLEDPRLERAMWAIAWKTVPAGEKEYYALVVLDQILGGGRTSLFYRELREKGLVYSVSTGDMGRPRDNLYVIYATFDPSKYQEVKERIFKLMQDLSTNLSDEDVEKAKERIINGEVFTQEKPQREAYFIGYSATVIGRLDYYLYFENNIRSVRKIDVLRVLERYFLGRPYVELLMVPKR